MSTTHQNPVHTHEGCTGCTDLLATIDEVLTALDSEAHAPVLLADSDSTRAELIRLCAATLRSARQAA